MLLADLRTIRHHCPKCSLTIKHGLRQLKLAFTVKRMIDECLFDGVPALLDHTKLDHKKFTEPLIQQSFLQ